MSVKPKKTVDTEGTVRWKLNRQYHREDGPAIEYVDGHREWWVNGLLIAMIDSNGILVHCRSGCG